MDERELRTRAKAIWARRCSHFSRVRSHGAVGHAAKDEDEKLTPAQVSKMQKSLEQARMLMRNIGVKNLGRKPASAGAKPKAEPKVETKPGQKRKR